MKMEKQYPSFSYAISVFAERLVAKSPRTATNYLGALNRFREFLNDTGIDAKTVTTDVFSQNVLEAFYIWLLRLRGREHRATAITYVSETRVFFRFLAQRRWLHPDISYERMKDDLRGLIGSVHYKTPRIDDSVALVVENVNNMEVPPKEHINERLVVLRNRAILNTLYTTGIRREELSKLNRSDIKDGYSSQVLLTGKGEKERMVFFDDTSLATIREYLMQRGDAHTPLFLRHDCGRGRPGLRGEHWRLSPQSIWGVVNKFGMLNGVKISTVDFRRFKASTLLNQGMDLSELQDILGHASPETTKRCYAAYTTHHLREAFDRFSLSAEDVVKQACVVKA